MSRLKLSLFIITLTLGIFALFRGLLLFSYPDEFSSLSIIDVLQAFFYGLRFDLSLISIFFALPLLLLNLPFKWFDNRFWVLFCFWTFLSIIIALCFLLAADLAYFTYVKRHISRELVLIMNDFSFIIQIALKSYKLALFSFTIFTALLLFLSFKYLPKTTDSDKAWHSNHITKRFVIFVLLFPLLFIGIRGGIQNRPIHIINAYDIGNPVQATLVLNGAYSALRSIDKKPSVSHVFYDEKTLNKNARDFELLDSEGRVKKYPFQQRFNHTTPNKLNVVVVLLESWSYKYIDALADNNYGVTPNFDSLVKQGLTFNRFYSAGQRSIEGLQAVLTSVPNLIDIPNLGWGLENSKFSRLGGILQQHGYETIFAQSSRRTSFHIDSIAAATGFKRYYGMEDMQLKLNYSDPDSFWYGWDHETFNKVHENLKTVKSPFVSFIFTGTTHSPFGTLPEEFLKYPHDANSEHGFLNTLYYADWAIGQFMQEARQQAWFDDTVFLFTADHPLGAYGKNTTLEQFHIPFLIYSPKHIKPGVNNTIGSHFDILPTIVDMLKLPNTFSSIGKSLFQKKNDNRSFAYIRSGNVTGLINKQGFMKHTLKNIIEAKTLTNKPMNTSTKNTFERYLLTLDQITYRAINANTWAE